MTKVGYKLNGLLIFAAGLSIGSVVTWQFLKKKYEDIAADEITSVKEVYATKLKEAQNNAVTTSGYISVDAEDNYEPESETIANSDVEEYDKVISNNGYVRYSAVKVDENGEVIEDNIEKGAPILNKEKPYIITPEEYGERDGFDQESLVYYADGILTDDWDNVIENIDETVGLESLTRFGEYEDDSVFVRNPDKEIDYEICLDQRKFSDVIQKDE